MFKKAVLIGANGSMGAKTAAIIASFGEIPVYMVARSIAKSKKGIEIAVNSVRSNIIRKNLIPATYTDLPSLLKQCDWVIEAVPENYKVKTEINRIIAKTKNKGRIITTLTSGLSVSALSEAFDDEDRKRYLGTHFFNPPYKMRLCEIIPTGFTQVSLLKDLSTYLEKKLLRVVFVTNDSPAFTANRIGFQFMNEAALFAEKFKHKGGIAYIDALLGRYTGRSLAPFETLDFVGLDVYKSIIDNLYENLPDKSSAKKLFRIPQYIQELIKRRQLGNKSGAGFYTVKQVNGINQKYVYDIKSGKYLKYAPVKNQFILSVQQFIHNGEYLKAFELIKNARQTEAAIVRHFFARYISYSLSLVGQIVESREMIDKAMGFGFNWLPPSALVDLIGGVNETISFIRKNNIEVPTLLLQQKNTRFGFYTLQKQLDYRSFIML